jgi:hypothetical protein
MLDALRSATSLEPAYREKAREDEDLEPYRDDPDFQTLVSEDEPA